MTVAIPDRSFTVIVGPNACGKSTLLRALARMLKPRVGTVILDGQAIGSLPSKEVARRLGLLPQSSIAPDAITVADLVARGRYPHQGILRQWSRDDEQAVALAMRRTAVDDLAGRAVDELSGGQRQRVWLAMALAQQTPLMLLDEPTTFLDIAHQLEVLDLCADLHEQHGHTVVTVLHDLNHACRYATHLIAMREGAIVAEGDPRGDRRRRARRARVRAALPRHPRPGDRAAAGGPGPPMTRPFPLHTGIATVAAIDPLTPA